jgi:hypothetical protein
MLIVLSLSTEVKGFGAVCSFEYTKKGQVNCTQFTCPFCFLIQYSKFYILYSIFLHPRPYSYSWLYLFLLANAYEDELTLV